MSNISQPTSLQAVVIQETSLPDVSRTAANWIEANKKNAAVWDITVGPSTETGEEIAIMYYRTVDNE